MSALLSVKFGDTIQMLADGASYGPDGTIAGLVRKLFVGRTAPIAVGVRGFSERALAGAALLCEWADFAGIDMFLERLKAEAGVLRNGSPLPRESQFHYTIGVWTAVLGARHFNFHAVPEFIGMPYAEVTELGSLSAFGTMFTEAELYEHGILPATGDPEVWAKKKGLAIMEMMRTRAGDKLPGLELDSGRYTIGGHVDLASVTSRGAKIERIRVWPDKEGEIIDPFSESANVSTIYPNRKARKAAASKARQRVAK